MLFIVNKKLNKNYDFHINCASSATSKIYIILIQSTLVNLQLEGLLKYYRVFEITNDSKFLREKI